MLSLFIQTSTIREAYGSITNYSNIIAFVTRKSSLSITSLSRLNDIKFAAILNTLSIYNISLSLTHNSNNIYDKI